MVKVKICGLTSERDVETCVEAGADALGFIFAPSARQVSVAIARGLTKLVPPFVTCVGVFAQNTASTVAAAVEQCRLAVLIAAPSLLLVCGAVAVVIAWPVESLLRRIPRIASPGAVCLATVTTRACDSSSNRHDGRRGG